MSEYSKKTLQTLLKTLSTQVSHFLIASEKDPFSLLVNLYDTNNKEYKYYIV